MRQEEIMQYLIDINATTKATDARLDNLEKNQDHIMQKILPKVASNNSEIGFLKKMVLGAYASLLAIVGKILIG